MRAILTYHSIDDSGSFVSCHPDAFARHVDWLASGRVTVTTIDQLLAMPPDEDAVALTFDDAYVNFGEVAAPRLLEHGLPVTVFVVSQLAGTTNRWDDGPRRVTPSLPLLDWDALARLHDRGVSLGAHSRTHADVSAIEDSALEDEIVRSGEEIYQRTGGRPAAFAYPFGHLSPASVRMVRRTYRYGVTTEFRVLSTAEDAALLPRLDMYYFQQPDSLAGWGRASFGARIRARQLARRARRLGGSTIITRAMRTS
jgi:peptidoglycan/xylan/chitin deacetylase (PgdA/CDA1 family)